MKNGFTLPEVIIYTLIATIIGGLLLIVMVNNSGLFFQQSTRINQGVGLNDATLTLRSTIKGAKSVAVGYPEVTPTFTSGPSTLVLKLPSINSSEQVIPEVFDFVVFVVENEKFRMKVYPSLNPASNRKSQDLILAQNVNSVSYKYLDAAGLEVSPVNAVKVITTLTLKQRTGLNYETNIATSEASLRND